MPLDAPGRDFQIFYSPLVKVRGGSHMSGGAIGTTSELGLCEGAVTVSPRFYHVDLRADDFGPEIPCETTWGLADVAIRMQLIHYDDGVLQIVLDESMANGGIVWGPDAAGSPGRVAPFGKLMGGNQDLYASGNHYVGLMLQTPDASGLNWVFENCYLKSRPLEIPLGANKSVVSLEWRCIPYKASVRLSGGPQSSGTTLWYYTTNTTLDDSAPVDPDLPGIWRFFD